MVTPTTNLDLADPKVALAFGFMLGQLVSAPQVRKEIQGALVAAIDAHGPITRANVGSATKRVAGSLRGHNRRVAQDVPPRPER